MTLRNEPPVGPRPPLPGETPLFRFNLDGYSREAAFMDGRKVGFRRGAVLFGLVGLICGVLGMMAALILAGK